MVVRRREQNAVTVDSIALGEHCLDFLGHAFLELEDIGIKKKHFTFALLEEDGVGEDVIMDARRRFKTVGKIAVANQVDVACGVILRRACPMFMHVLLLCHAAFKAAMMISTRRSWIRRQNRSS